jgi:PAS domain-containing protein
MSPHVEELLGVPAQEFIDREDIWDVLIHPDDRERSRLDYEEFLRTGQPETASIGTSDATVVSSGFATTP